MWDRRESFFVSVVFHNMDMDQSSHIFAISGSTPLSTSNPSPHTALVLIPYHTTASARLQRVTFTALDRAGLQRSAYGTHGVPRIGCAGHTVIITPLTDLTAFARQAFDTFVTTGTIYAHPARHGLGSPDAISLGADLSGDFHSPHSFVNRFGSLSMSAPSPSDEASYACRGASDQHSQSGTCHCNAGRWGLRVSTPHSGPRSPSDAVDLEGSGTCSAFACIPGFCCRGGQHRV